MSRGARLARLTLLQPTRCDALDDHRVTNGGLPTGSPASAVHDIVRWSTVGGVHRSQGPGAGVPEREHVGASVCVGEVELFAAALLVADDCVRGPDPLVGGDDGHCHHRLAEVGAPSPIAPSPPSAVRLDVMACWSPCSL